MDIEHISHCLVVFASSRSYKMDGEIKRSRRSRSQRDRVRRRDAIDRNDQNRSPSSGSDRGQSPFRNKALCNYGKMTNLHYVRPPRPSRRKRRGSVSQEEDIIDGFAIASFLNLDSLEVALRKTSKSLRLQEGKEKWESQMLKKRKASERAEIPVNVFTDNGADFEHEQDGEKERGKVKNNSKKNKQVKGLLGRQDRAEVTKTQGTHQRSNSKGHNRESSFSGRGYSCDSESDIDDKVSGIVSDKLFTLRKTTGVDQRDEAKVCSFARVSGLQRSQEQSSDTPLDLPAASSAPGALPAASPVPAAPLTTTPPPAVCVKKERTSPHNPTMPTLPGPGLSQVKREPLSHHQGHPLYIGLHNSIEGSHKRTLPPSPHFGRHSSPLPALPLSVSELSAPHFFLPGHGHRRPTMFTSPSGLATSSIVGRSTRADCSEHDLLRQELNNRFLAQTAVRGAGSEPPLLRAEFHQHTHQHQHQHQHQLTFSPYPNGLPPPPGIVSTPPNMGRTAALNLEKYSAKLENPYLRHQHFYPSYPPAMPGMPALHPHSGPPGPFSSLQGAFQPKSMDVVTRPEVPHNLLPKDPRITDPFRSSARKAGKWCLMHGQIAWQIHHHQQRMKNMHFDSHQLNMSRVKLDLFSRPAAPGLPPGLSYGHDLARPFLSSSGHLSASPFSAPTHHSHYLPASHLTDPFGRASHYGNLGQLATNAFGGLGTPSLGPGSPFGDRQSHGLPGFVSHPQEAWNRLQRMPPSFPTPPAQSRPADVARKPTVQSSEREREREAKKRDHSATKEESERDGNSLERSHQSTHTSSGFQISNLIGSSSPERKRSSPDQGHQAERDGTSLGRVQVKQSSSPALEVQDKGSSNPYNTVKNHQSSESTQTLKGPLNIKQEHRDEPEVMAGPPEITLLLPPGHSQAPHPSSRRSHFPTAGMLQSSHLPHSLPLSMSPMHPVSSLSAMERARVQPFMGVSPLATGRDHRVPLHLSGAWDPLRDPYRGLYLQSQQVHTTYDPERGHRQREQHPHPQPQQHQQDSHRQAEERARLHQLQGSPMEGHLAHTPTFTSSLGGVMYPRLSPSAPHSGHLNRTPPTATLSAPPPLVPTSTTSPGIPSTPRKTTPTSAPPSGDPTPSCNPKEVEAQ
ncbi:autism susceptibility gene 2 protein homolog isoform X2 [Salmo salar]|uniref:Autism susceptibility gene 2 protein homolog isoform X2 n=1 Tax=Salmo salar TaxID=8030 RepID=A0A1S3LS52_SALSA|nr:autism susceptibility gene 2 protein homolog isoform X2 [Salmo salar]|eukprot:XP_013993808.1 PREDICTED: autism susceptibility gene 2 protein-like isoform X2 [Salmo salar]